MKMFIPISIIVPAITAQAAEIKLPPRPEKYTRHSYLESRIEVKPLFDTPLRHTFIMRAPEGGHYLAGTVSADDQGADFQNNRGVRLWKSADMKTWEDIGFVWEIEKDGGAWHKQKNLNPDDPAGPLVRGVTAPEIHFLKGTWWIPYSMNGHGTGLLKSTSGKPEGPYEDMGRMTAGEGNASLFEDFDGAVYWVWGPGRIAKMKPDMSGLAEQPVQLTLGLNQDSIYFGRRVHVAGAHFPESVFLFKTAEDKKGSPRYHLMFESGSCQLGGYTKDTFLASAATLPGPYEKYEVLLDHGAQSVVFQDAAGNWFGTFYGDDPLALFRDRAAIVTTPFDKSRGRPSRFHYFKDFTSCGPWATMMPLFDDGQINDQQILNAPDGHYYFTGSVWDNFRYGAAIIWKSKTLEPRSVKPENWREIRVCPFTDIPALQRAAERVPGLFEFSGLKRNTELDGVAWGTEIHYIKGNYWILYQILAKNAIVQEEMKKDGGANPIFRSATGKAEGPYVYHAMLPASAASLFEDDDGSVYLGAGTTVFQKLKDDMTGVDMEWVERMQKERGYGKALANLEGLAPDYDIGFSMVKIGGKYVIFTCNCVGGYDQQYWVSKDILGPFGRPRVMMPYGGHSFVMKDKEGKWHSLQWAGTTAMAPCLHELHVEDTGDDVVMMPKFEWDHRQAAKRRP